MFKWSSPMWNQFTAFSQFNSFSLHQKKVIFMTYKGPCMFPMEYHFRSSWLKICLCCRFFQIEQMSSWSQDMKYSIFLMMPQTIVYKSKKMRVVVLKYLSYFLNISAYLVMILIFIYLNIWMKVCANVFMSSMFCWLMFTLFCL